MERLGRGWLGLGVQGPPRTPGLCSPWSSQSCAWAAFQGQLQSGWIKSLRQLRSRERIQPGTAAPHGLRAATATNVTHGDPTGTPQPSTRSLGSPAQS